VSIRNSFLVVALAVPLLGANAATGLAADKKLAKEPAFGTLQTLGSETARTQALDWLKTAGKSDDATMKAFDAIWATPRPLADQVADTLALGDADAKQLLDEARDTSRPAPETVPAVFKDTKRTPFYRANLALAYAKALAHRRIYEEGLDAMKTVKPEQVVDPSAYLFNKAVAEHALMLKPEAENTIVRLLDETPDAPERYKMVAALMFFDMQTWQDKDLGFISRKMDNIERRLDLSRGGPKTQQMQKEVISRLDELIKRLENQKNGGGQCNGGGCPGGGSSGSQPGNTNQPSSPQRDSMGGTNGGPGNVDERELAKLAKQWGKLPEKERAAAMQRAFRNMPAKYQDIIEAFMKKQAQMENSK
jgi:hypothetical protein